MMASPPWWIPLAESAPSCRGTGRRPPSCLTAECKAPRFTPGTETGLRGARLGWVSPCRWPLAGERLERVADSLTERRRWAKSFNGFAAKLFSEDVVYLERQRERGFGEGAILASVGCSVANSPRKLLVHCWLEGACFRSRRALDCMTA